MVVRDFRVRGKSESALLKRTRTKGQILVRHLSETDCCPSCVAEALTSLHCLHEDARTRLAEGKLPTPEYRLVEAEVAAIARRLTAIAAFNAFPHVIVGGAQ